jgi:hypothetical protein
LSTTSPLFVIPKTCIPHCATAKFNPANKAIMVFGKRTLSVIMVVLLALLLIAIVIWIYDKKMQDTNKRMRQLSVFRNETSNKNQIYKHQKINHENNFPFSLCIAAEN